MLIGAIIGGVIGNLIGWALPEGVVKDFFLTSITFDIGSSIGNEFGVIVIDFLQLLEDRTLGQNISREDEISKILNDLKNLSINFLFEYYEN